MQRTNLILDHQLVAKAKKFTDEKTKTGTIHYALDYLINEKSKQQQIENFRKLRGSKGWVGNLKQLRKSRV